MIQFLFKKSINFSPLQCIRKRSFRYVKKCLKDDSSAVHRSNKQGIFPLHVSAQYGYLDIVQLLLDNGAGKRDMETFLRHLFALAKKLAPRRLQPHTQNFEIYGYYQCNDTQQYLNILFQYVIMLHMLSTQVMNQLLRNSFDLILLRKWKIKPVTKGVRPYENL